MYGETPSVKVGEFTISRQNPDGNNGSVWIQHESYDGAEFKDELFEAAVKDFYVKKL